ncbi:hypothetical protein AMTRI_Chr10g231630 [Amborella trichopoda]
MLPGWSLVLCLIAIFIQSLHRCEVLEIHIGIEYHVAHFKTLMIKQILNVNDAINQIPFLNKINELNLKISPQKV